MQLFIYIASASIGGIVSTYYEKRLLPTPAIIFSSFNIYQRLSDAEGEA